MQSDMYTKKTVPLQQLELLTQHGIFRSVQNMNFFFDKENMIADGTVTDSAIIEHDDPSL